MSYSSLLGFFISSCSIQPSKYPSSFPSFGFQGSHLSLPNTSSFLNIQPLKDLLPKQTPSPILISFSHMIFNINFRLFGISISLTMATLTCFRIHLCLCMSCPSLSHVGTSITGLPLARKNNSDLTTKNYILKSLLLLGPEENLWFDLSDFFSKLTQNMTFSPLWHGHSGGIYFHEASYFLSLETWDCMWST